MDFEIFIEILFKALDNVDEIYYGKVWWNDSMLNAHYITEDNPIREQLEQYLSRHGERVFCYEFYHHMRILMDSCQKDNPNNESSIVLQGELKKELIGNLIEDIFKVTALDKEYIPDFLLHSPGDFEHQELVMEVKANPKLNFSSIKEDLLKIQQFIERYKYLHGIFLTINTEPMKIIKLLNNNINWISSELANKEKILFICKQSKNTPYIKFYLDNIPN